MSNDSSDILNGRRNRGAVAILQRLRWLEDRLYWLGELNRADIASKFKLSPQQSSADIALYKSVAPNNILYDTKNKQYVRDASFSAVFDKSCADWLLGNGKEQADLRSLAMERVAPLQRSVPDEVIRAVARSYRQRVALRVQYQSMRSPAPEVRSICPHAVVDVGVRWHVRAWDSKRTQFCDLLPSRILATESDPATQWVPQEADTEWNNFARIILVPDPKLTPDQRSSVEKDFMMTDGERVIETREALAYYQLAAMNLVDAVRTHKGHPTDRNLGVSVRNWADLQKHV